MQILAFLTIWIPAALMLAVLLPSGPLNRHVRAVGRSAEQLSWIAFACAAVALGGYLGVGRTAGPSELSWNGTFGIRVDSLSLIMLGLVTFLGAIIVRYSRNYLSGDPRQGYFFKWLLFTLGAVASLCVSPGLIQFGLSWILTSLGLHQLLVYFPERRGMLLSARKKYVVSRMGDLCLIAAFVGLYTTFDSQNLGEIFAALEVAPERMAAQAWIGWLIILGAILKSAQFPFHTWLPDTMATPTPVSALMHAGIINAGGFLVVRLSPALVETPSALVFLASAGALSAIYGSLVMQTQTSVKRALAYSTIAQMGFMMLQCGLGAFSLAILHLVAHSLYKAHAFLSSGSKVAELKFLPRQTAAPLRQSQLVGAITFGFAAVFTLCWIWGIAPINKPGILVLGVVLAFASAQLVLGRLAQGTTRTNLLKAAATAIAFVALYLGLSKGFGWILADSMLPRVGYTGTALQIAMGLALAVYFYGCMRVLNPLDSRHLAHWQKALYIHALNGFYLNTWANRALRRLGLVPAGR